ncbi:LolA family protein [Campylobacter hyointestinalis]|uniref:LolA family protein n=1 Tax=Campylobacter hyointestinalis TaxID=198 RepID=UPI00072A16B5|nr:outer membrane lipoprotein carrier protein LolA [Campylobacter hyointestinalis]PPB70246.1 outer membrane lipoprotein carrier protein LolA [Campylobacter hyointestinalis subsp. hyointestinalis]CUU73813.1 flagellum-specific ATP synthase [Campylobacter hyointestinalis subsp. hyointestinalis]CUU76460.1 flagellum-specific ATP synthase [Campylobacter hyointestinalis subsp. hyointestinalis]CUU80426.1 flagellum-specific ATP synthase [Campylobacter hyointestinalis subsp. hyointestinalis]
MKKAALLLLFVSLAFAFDISELLSHIKTDDIRGKFRQIKQISGFKNKLISSGNFSLSGGVFEQNTTKPVNLSIKVDENGVFEFDGKNYNKISPLFDKELFLNILNLNLDALKSDFELSLSGDDQSWSIDLKPRNFISKIFENITISGDEFIRSMVLNETSKDVTRYEFFDIKAGF